MSNENPAERPPEEDYSADLLALEDEDGQEHTFEVLDATDIDGARYLALVPYHEDPAKRLDQDAEMVIMRVGEDEGEEVLDVVDNEEELFSVGQVFLNRLSELYEVDLEELGDGDK